ncbi:MAG: hypothetical protein JO113_08710, partial [Candidatus Eremiobacteraeota bacterium]|nr:hypothetical protein [Candidatus Eremiobacteraeota bacterium]
MIFRRLGLCTLAALALAAAACSSNSVNAGAPLTPLARHDASDFIASKGSQGKISHVVVIVQENRSFEDFFAGYPGANAPMSGCGVPTPTPQTSAPPVEAPMRPMTSGSPCPPGDITIPLHAVTFKDNPDLKHDWQASIHEWDNGKMDGWTEWGMKNGQWTGYVYEDRTEVK